MVSHRMLLEGADAPFIQGFPTHTLPPTKPGYVDNAAYNQCGILCTGQRHDTQSKCSRQDAKSAKMVVFCVLCGFA